MNDEFKLRSVDTGQQTSSVKPKYSGYPPNTLEAQTVLTIHGALPKGENSATALTIRQLFDLCTPWVSGLLKEYVCAFGAHGVTVINNYVFRTAIESGCSKEEAQHNLAEFQDEVDSEVRRLWPAVSTYIDKWSAGSQSS